MDPPATPLPLPNRRIHKIPCVVLYIKFIIPPICKFSSTSINGSIECPRRRLLLAAGAEGGERDELCGQTTPIHV